MALVLFLAFSFLKCDERNAGHHLSREVFSTEVLGIGTGFAAAVGRIGAGLGTFLLPVGIETLGVSAVMLIVALIVFSAA